ncbi:MAG: pilus assembly protein CpaF [Propionibacteriales bacterium]|nr:MAG: pilus assembly protein CpaF [Propionibacteriales bacterium]
MLTASELEQVRLGLAKRSLGRSPKAEDVAGVLADVGSVVSDASVLEVTRRLRQDLSGAGPLQPLLARPGITDVLVNGCDQVFIDRGAGMEQVESCFADEDEVRELAVRFAAQCGRRLDDASPFVDAQLPDGTRVHAILAPMASPGTCISLRVPAHRSFSLEDWVAGGGMSDEVCDILRRLIRLKRAFLVTGGTGSGKTTLLAGMLSEVSAAERIVVVEDSRELAPRHGHVVRLEARRPNVEGAGAIPMTALVRQALRMRPDRLIVGEVRGAELSDMLHALNTGHEGGCGTIHANCSADVPARLLALGGLAGLSPETLRLQVAAALNLVISLERVARGNRVVTEIGIFEADATQLRVVPAISRNLDGSYGRGAGWPLLAELIAP